MPAQHRFVNVIENDEILFVKLGGFGEIILTKNPAYMDDKDYEFFKKEVEKTDLVTMIGVRGVIIPSLPHNLHRLGEININKRTAELLVISRIINFGFLTLSENIENLWKINLNDNPGEVSASVIREI